LLEIKDLEVYYDGIHAIKGVSLTVPQGALVTLVGSNGAGKTTLLRTICGLKRPSSGQLVFEGQNLLDMSVTGIVQMGITMVPEGRQIFPDLTVMENLRLGAYTRTDQEGIAFDQERVFNLFPRLKERAAQKGGTLSGGEQQMLAIARGLMARPSSPPHGRTFPGPRPDPRGRSLPRNPGDPFRRRHPAPHRTERPGSPGHRRLWLRDGIRKHSSPGERN